MLHRRKIGKIKRNKKREKARKARESSKTEDSIYDQRSNYDIYSYWKMPDDLKKRFTYCIVDEKEKKLVQKRVKEGLLTSVTAFTSLTNAVIDLPEKKIYLRWFHDACHEDKLMFTDDLLEIIPIVLARRGKRLNMNQLEKYRKKWKNSNRNMYTTIGVKGLEVVMTQFGIEQSDWETIPDPSSLFKLLEFFGSKLDPPTVISWDMNVVMENVNAILYVFFSTVCGFNWTKMTCKKHRNCAANYKKQIMNVVKEYEELPKGTYIKKERVEETIGQLQKHCIYTTKIKESRPDYQLKGSAISAPQDVETFKNDLEFFGLSNIESYIWELMEGRETVTTWFVRHAYLRLWVTSFFGKSKCDIQNALLAKIPDFDEEARFGYETLECREPAEENDLIQAKRDIREQMDADIGGFIAKDESEEEEIEDPEPDPEPIVVEKPKKRKSKKKNKKSEPTAPPSPPPESNSCAKCARTSEYCSKAQEELIETKAELKSHEKKVKDYKNLVKRHKKKLKEIKELRLEKDTMEVVKNKEIAELRRQLVAQNKRNEELEVEKLRMDESERVLKEDNERLQQDISDLLESGSPSSDDPSTLTLHDYQHIRDNFPRERLIQEAEQMDRALRGSELRGLAQHELLKLRRNIRIYLETLDSNIRNLSNVMELPEYPSISQSFQKEYWDYMNKMYPAEPKETGFCPKKTCYICFENYKEGEKVIICGTCERPGHLKCCTDWRAAQTTEEKVTCGLCMNQ